MSVAESRLLESVASFWPAEKWRDVNVAVALSGGADSVSLLRLVTELKRQAGGAGVVSAIHVNHQLRGEESAADADWCRQFCDSRKVSLKVCSASAAQRAAEDGDGIEAAARQERYRLLTEAAEAVGARYLATAHTADDQVETVLMRILRGSGLRGLCGIPRLRVLTPTLTLVRPLLGCSRSDLEALLAELGQTFRTDRTNFESEFTRNRVRNDLLPLLREQYHSDINETLLRLSAQAEEAHQVLEQAAARVLAECDLRHEDAELSLLTAPLAAQPMLIACEALRLAWRQARLSEQAMTRQWWQRLAGLCEEPAVLNLPGNVRAEVVGERLRLSW